MNIAIKFPNNEDVELEPGKPVVILGANGSGKTRLTAKIEEMNDKRFCSRNLNVTDILIHRITAQKSLSISNKIPLSDYDSSHKELYVGNIDAHATKSVYRYGLNPAIHPVNDYDKVLSLFFAEEHKELQYARKQDRSAIANGAERPDLIPTVQERATKIWNDLLPQRKILLEGNGINVQHKENKYHGREMSDGERVMLYMICQALILPKNSVIIIDEPELHIHRAIVKTLWDRLEQERQDCVFMYVTHDLDFAASRITDKILWTRGYDGISWEYEWLEAMEFDTLSDELVFEIIGTRKKILFVEGERNSCDYDLYSEYYKDKGYHVIPCGGCSEVISIYKAMKSYKKLSGIEAHCIIDRDYRTEGEIASLKADGVAFLEVAEIENLFVVPALLDIMEIQLGCSRGVSMQAQNFIIDLFNRTKAGQVREAFIKEVNHQLTILNYDDKTMSPIDLQSDITNKFSAEAIQDYFEKKQQIFNTATTLDDILKIYNFKELPKKIGSKFGLRGNSYAKRVVNFIKSNPKEIKTQIFEALKPYVPELP